MKFITTITLLLTLTLYNNWTTFIKQHEGLVLTKYEDILGNPTIGYGHLIKAEEVYTTITVAQAEYLLDADFNASIKLVQNLYPDKPDHQILSLAHFVYAKGIGSFTRSGLKKAIDRNASPRTIWKEWIEWAKVDGSYSIQSMRSRSLEYYTYYNFDFDKLNDR